MVSLPFEQLGTPAEERPYYPYPIADDLGIPLPDPQPPQSPPGVELVQGKVPNFKQAGKISVGGELIGAFDHFRAQFFPDRIEIEPASKKAVNKDGEIIEEGVIGLFDKDKERLKLAAFAINIVRNPWLLQRFGRRVPVGGLRGEVAVVPANVLELPEYELSDVDSKTGLLTARPRKKFY